MFLLHYMFVTHTQIKFSKMDILLFSNESNSCILKKILIEGFEMKDFFGKIAGWSVKTKIIAGVSALLILSATVTGVFLLQGNQSGKHVIQFESNGGSVVGSQTVSTDETVVVPDPPEKPGFIFMGWAYNGEPFDFTMVVTEDIVLEAIWESDGTTVVLTVDFDSNGGSDVDPIQVSEGYPVTAPINPVKSGYVFKGWYLDGMEFDFDAVITEDILLTAEWTANKNTGSSSESKDTNETDNQTESDNDPEVVENNVNTDITWNEMLGKWYYKGSDDVYVVISKESDGYSFMGTRFDYSTGTIYGNGGGGSGWDVSTEPYVFAQHFNITDVSGSSITICGKSLYKTANYPSHIVSELEQYAKDLEGTWYLYGYGSDVTMTFTAGIRYDEKVLFFEQRNFCLQSATVYPSTCSGTSYYSYYTLLSTNVGLTGETGLRYSNGEVTVPSSSGTLRFVSSPYSSSVTGVTLDKETATLSAGGTVTLVATVKPSNAGIKTVTWSSSDTGVVTVDSKGKVTAKNVGTATITVKTDDGGYTDTATITVNPTSVSGISLNTSSISIYYNKTSTLTATVSPSNATNKNVSWSSSNPSVASVNSNGVVTGTGEGDAVITAASADGGFTATCSVHVTYPPLSANGSIGVTQKVTTNEGAQTGIVVDATASGGTGSYSYNIKLYYSGSMIGESSSSSLFVAQTSNGTYEALITVTDSNGTIASVTKNMTKN